MRLFQPGDELYLRPEFIEAWADRLGGLKSYCIVEQRLDPAFGHEVRIMCTPYPNDWFPLGLFTPMDGDED